MIGDRLGKAFGWDLVWEKHWNIKGFGAAANHLYSYDGNKKAERDQELKPE